MRRRFSGVLLAVLALAWAGGAGAAAPGRTVLLSIEDVPLAAGDYIEGFSIDTFGVSVLAACHIPFGWMLTLGNDDAASGTIRGEAAPGVTPAARDLRGLKDVVLLRVHDPGDGSPFAGFLRLGRRGENIGPLRLVPLTGALLTTRPAARCPGPQ